MRLFTGTFIDNSLLEYILPEIREDFDSATSGKWVELENLHFTYNFLGDVDDKKFEEVKAALKPYIRQYNSEIFLRGMSLFPNLKRARVLVINVDNPSGDVVEVQKAMTRELEQVGFEPEKRKFRPHATLQRIKSSKTGELKEAIEKYRGYDFGMMPSFSVDLIRSELTKMGPVYTRVKI